MHNVASSAEDLIQILDQRIVQIALLAHALQVVMGKDVEIVHRGWLVEHASPPGHRTVHTSIARE
eukprot:3284406-Amphidinium_carterae.1